MTRFFSLLLALALAAPVVGLVGCDADEKIMDVETPQGDVEVERDLGTGNLEIED